MKLLSNEYLNELNSKINVGLLLFRYNIPSKKISDGYLCNCPFHEDTNPSLHFDSSKKIFFCHGCGEKGNSIQFIQKIERCGFRKAVEILAEMTKTTAPSDEAFFEKLDPLPAKKFDNIMSLATLYFFNALTITSYGKKPLEYLSERKIDLDMIKEWGVGYAPAGWTRMLDAFSQRGFSCEDMRKVGLVSKSRGRYFDRFRDRIIFPIRDDRGKVIAFGGRTFCNDDAKYINSTSNQRFQKRKTLFGLSKAIPFIKEESEVIVVEGYFDAIAMNKIGFKNVVATMGTAFSASHAKILRNYAKRIIFCFDMDDPGLNAIMNARSVADGFFAEYLYSEYGAHDPADLYLKDEENAKADICMNLRKI